MGSSAPPNLLPLYKRYSSEISEKLFEDIIRDFLSMLFGQFAQQGSSNQGPGVANRIPFWTPETFTVKFKISLKEDAKLLHDMGPTKIVNKFRQVGQDDFADWAEISATRLRQDIFEVHTMDKEMAQKIPHRCDEIKKIFGLSGSCRYIPSVYSVEAIDFDMDERAFKDLNQNLLNEWSKENGVLIQNARWTYKRLVLEFAQKEDALALCTRDVFLSGMKGRVE